jgi:hypothetical protein
MALIIDWNQELVKQLDYFAFKLQVCEDDRERELKHEKGSREKRNLHSDLRPQVPVVPAHTSANVSFKHAPAIHTF